MIFLKRKKRKRKKKEKFNVFISEEAMGGSIVDVK